jgi:hypothetical protein
MSSEQLLSNLTADNQQTQLPSNVESCNEQLADGIIRYLNDCEEYKATSSSIISRFKIRVSGEEEVILFRKLLKQIARFERSFPTDRGYWILKNEFRRLAARQ